VEKADRTTAKEGEAMSLAEERTGPVTAKLGDRSPFGAMERLEHDTLVRGAAGVGELAPPALFDQRPSLFAVMDRLYGRERTLAKFRVLGLVARLPYQAWENVAYVTVTHSSRQRGFERRVFDTVRLARWEQDNEQWHLLILEELTAAERQQFIRHRVIPQILAFLHYQLSWAMYVVRPAWSYRLNADFEDHAEHEYALSGRRAPGMVGHPVCEQLHRRFRCVRLAGRPVPPDQLRRTPPQARVRDPHGIGSVWLIRQGLAPRGLD
jgi:ubiquinol oxidase